MKKFLDQYFKLIRRFIPRREPAPSCGIDIGSSDCKLIELRTQDKGFLLTRWDVKSIDNNDVGGALKTLINSLETPCKNLYTAIFGKGSLIRYVEMPRMPLDEVRKSFEIEADKYFPFSQDQIYTDCFILDPQGKSKKMMVMAAAARKELIDQRIEILTKLGVQPELIGINAVALLNAMNRLGLKDELEPGTAIALLDMGEAVSSLSILVDKMPWFTRDIFIGGRDFTKKIQNSLGIDLKQAEELKKNPGDKKESVASACELVIMNVLQELRLSFDYFSTEKNKEIKKLYLTGGGCMLEGIVEIFEKNFDVKVEIWDPFDKLIMTEEMKKTLGKNTLRLGVALGLALYDYD